MSNRVSTSPGQTGAFSGDGEMMELIRSKDWSLSPLGPPEGWPQSLRTTISLCLASNFPINIIWGREHTQIYNDGYRIVCGGAHPAALGESYTKTWASAWPAIGEPFERALTGETTFLENQRMFLFRGGYLEETFFTFSLSPILDESGGIGGLFHPVNETTASMLAERRTRAIRDLNARLAESRTTKDTVACAIDVLQRYEFDLPFVQLYELVNDDGGYLLTGRTGLRDGASIPALPAEAWPVAAIAAATEPVLLNDIATLIDPLCQGPYDEPPHMAFGIPINIPGSERPIALMIVGVSSRLPLDDAYRSFFHLLSGSFASGLANAKYYEEQNQRAEALAALDRAKIAFFSNVSHEFRTPLTLMLGPIEDALEDAAGLPPAQHERLRVAHRNAKRLLRLVNSLLDFSRIEAGRTEARFEATDLSAYTAELASNFRSACERAGLTLVVDCPAFPDFVHVDRQMWEKVVLNLLSNAFKFTLEGRIAVSLINRDDHVELTVRDSGVGIVAHELPRLFERFHRIEGQKGRTHEGSGIGLALVTELVALHGGSVRAESTVGQGSAFIVTLPLGTDHLPREQIVAAYTPQRGTLVAEAYVAEALQWLPTDDVVDDLPPDADAEGVSKPVIVLADDNADMRAYVKRLLEQGGYAVAAVENGRAALEAIRNGPLPDLVLSDVMMPELDGFGLLAAIRADETLKGLLVVLLSARAGEEARVEGLAAGADDYLVKPFSARELRARVDGAVNLAYQRRLAAERERELQAEIDGALARATLHQTEQQLDLALQAGRMGSWDLDLETGRLLTSAYCRQNFGLGPDDIVDREDDMVAYIHPEDRDLRQRAIDVAIKTGGDLDLEYRTQWPDGRITWIQSRGRAVYQGDKPVRLAGVLFDITERKEAESRQKLMVDELNHRVKNTLATVQSLAFQTRRFVDTRAGFDEVFIARLEALARAHNLLSESSWAGAALGDVLRETLEPYFYADDPDRISVQGPKLRLGPNAAVTLNMAFHELATNAAKYGSLSVESGRVDVRWRFTGSGGRQMVEIDWREAGGPPVSIPLRRGFGSRLIERGISHELSGETVLTFDPAGLWCRICLPLSAKLGRAA